MFWGCGDDIQVFALFATKFEADLCVFPAKFAKTRKLNQTFAYNDTFRLTGVEKLANRSGSGESGLRALW